VPARRDFSAARLAGYERRVAESWAGAEMKSMRNFHQAFDGGLWTALPRTGFQMFTGGLDPLGDHLAGHAGHERMKKLRDVHPAGKPAALKADGKLTFDKLADVYLSGTMHDEDQPVHLLVADTSVCATKCREEYGNPCQHFCPAAVYEMIPDRASQARSSCRSMRRTACTARLRHRRSVPDHHLDDARGRRRTELQAALSIPTAPATGRAAPRRAPTSPQRTRAPSREGALVLPVETLD